MLRSFTCMKLSNRGRTNVHLTLNVLKMYSKCTPDVHFTQFPTTTTEKTVIFFKFASHKCTQMYENVHFCTFIYICITKNTRLVGCTSGLHLEYISSTSRVHLDVQKCDFNWSPVALPPLCHREIHAPPP